MIKLNNWLISAWKANVSVSAILSLKKEKNPETQNLFFEEEEEEDEESFSEIQKKEEE